MTTFKSIRVAIAGLGNCASSLIEGIQYYRQNPESDDGLLFPYLAGYSVCDIDIVTAFDISDLKVGKLAKEAIYQAPNNFVRIPDVQVDNTACVFRGPTLDGNPEHLARFVHESPEEPVDVVSVLKDNDIDVLVNMLESRGASLRKTSQVNIGGNTDFANFVHRAESKLVSKRKSLARYLNENADFHVGHHYDPTKGPLKNAFIEIEAAVFGGSPLKISIKLESDDKPNSAGSVVDLIRIARGAIDQGIGGYIPDACAFYFKSPPTPMDDLEALEMIRKNWVPSHAEVVRE